MQSSSPLTPAQTRPPSPLLIHGDTHIHPDCTLPKRTALGSLNAFVTNCNVPTPPSVKRKRSLVDKVDANTRVEIYGQRSNSLPCDIIDDISPVPLLGCGRIICRACCVENVEYVVFNHCHGPRMISNDQQKRWNIVHRLLHSTITPLWNIYYSQDFTEPSVLSLGRSLHSLSSHFITVQFISRVLIVNANIESSRL